MMMTKLTFFLFLKDRFCLSDEAYHELSMLTADVPRSHRVKAMAKKINSKSVIHSTPNNSIGVQQSLNTCLRLRLDQLLSDKPDLKSALIDGKTLRIKLSGDGTSLARSMHVINFTFTMLVEERHCSAAGNHLLAILKEPEKYEKSCCWSGRHSKRNQ